MNVHLVDWEGELPYDDPRRELRRGGGGGRGGKGGDGGSSSGGSAGSGGLTSDTSDSKLSFIFKAETVYLLLILATIYLLYHFSL